MWSEMSKAAKPEYWWICEKFIEYNNNDPGTHKSVVAETMGHIMEQGRLTMSYKVRPDSKAAIVSGSHPPQADAIVHGKARTSRLLHS